MEIQKVIEIISTQFHEETSLPQTEEEVKVLVSGIVTEYDECRNYIEKGSYLCSLRTRFQGGDMRNAEMNVQSLFPNQTVGQVLGYDEPQHPHDYSSKLLGQTYNEFYETFDAVLIALENQGLDIQEVLQLYYEGNLPEERTEELYDKMFTVLIAMRLLGYNQTDLTR